MPYTDYESAYENMRIFIYCLPPKVIAGCRGMWYVTGGNLEIIAPASAAGDIVEKEFYNY